MEKANPAGGNFFQRVGHCERAEGRRQKAEGGGQKAEGGGRRAEGGGCLGFEISDLRFELDFAKKPHDEPQISAHLGSDREYLKSQVAGRWRKSVVRTVDTGNACR
jgi:hypothetical protein